MLAGRPLQSRLCADDLGRRAAAVAVLRGQVALIPDAPDAWSQLGQVFFGDGRAVAAAACWRRDAALRPGSGRAAMAAGSRLAAGWADAKTTACDFHIPLMSLPGALGTTLRNVPAPVPYLRADLARIARWRERIGEDGFRVGVVWAGKPSGGRSAPLAAFAPLAAVPGVRLFSLQKHHGLADLNALPAGMRVETLGEDFDAGPDAFLDTAAAACVLDLVVSVDAAPAHVAGALGRPAWLALSAAPDWRWFIDFPDRTPWYPATRLFRPPRPGD